ncbi:MAG: PDR/VanB family oxidoreductase [Bacillota bacterium]
MKGKRISVYIKSIQVETPKVKSFTLAAIDGASLPAFSGGAHIQTFLQQPSLVRHYSLIGSTYENDTYKIAVGLAEDSKGGSLFWHEKARVGDILEMSYPRNHFPLSYRARHHVFYAAGIGITPYLSMMADLKRKGKSFELHYATKTKDLCAFYTYLQQHYSRETRFYFSGQGERLKGEGLTDHLIGTHVYFCGPDSFISSHLKMCEDIGYPASSVHSEQFSAPLIRACSSFTAEISSGMSISVPADKSLLDSLLGAGIEVPYSCRVGRCGTCELRVLEGEIVHYDTFLSDEQKNAQDVIVSCVSRSNNKIRIVCG